MESRAPALRAVSGRHTCCPRRPAAAAPAGARPSPGGTGRSSNGVASSPSARGGLVRSGDTKVGSQPLLESRPGKLRRCAGSVVARAADSEGRGLDIPFNSLMLSCNSHHSALTCGYFTNNLPWHFWICFFMAAPHPHVVTKAAGSQVSCSRIPSGG